MFRGKEVIKPKKEGTTEIEKVTRVQQYNYWRGMREDKATKRQQQDLSITNPDSLNPDKIFIPDQYNNQTELKKLKR